ncbi:hypothetical protein LZ31DRAFT_11926 [Colletotrichum somersetense]|nr:hypothetical protein LZ31DRAFT_11926 [Colletotrichum somersetense]
MTEVLERARSHEIARRQAIVNYLAKMLCHGRVSEMEFLAYVGRAVCWTERNAESNSIRPLLGGVKGTPYRSSGMKVTSQLGRSIRASCALGSSLKEVSMVPKSESPFVTPRFGVYRLNRMPILPVRSTLASADWPGQLSRVSDVQFATVQFEPFMLLSLRGVIHSAVLWIEMSDLA